MTQNKPAVVVSVNVAPDLLALIEQQCEVHRVDVGQRPEQALPPPVLQRIGGLLCTLRTAADAELFRALPALKVVSNMAVGYDNVNVEAATREGVLVCNTPEVLDAAVADIGFGLVLCLGRRLVELDRFTRDGRWLRGAPPYGWDLAGKTLGLLGMGRIGRLVAQRARAFGMEVVYHNRSRDAASEAAGLARYVDRNTLFTGSDFVSVHVPLTEATRHSVGASEFARMKKTAYVINTSRGAVLDEAALVAALQAGTIAGAGLDVMTKEPLDTASPLIGMDNVVLLPHVGSATHETRRAMIELAVHNLLDAVRGDRPRAMVNPAVWPQLRQGKAHA